MNILQLRSEFRDNGPGTQPLTLACELRERRHRVVFVGGGGVFAQTIRDRGFEFFEVPSLAVNRRSMLDSIRNIYNLRRIIGEQDINVVHAHNAAAAAQAIVASKLCRSRCAVVQSVRGIELRESHQWRNRIYSLMRIQYLAVSDFTRESLLGFGVPGKNITVSFNGVDTSRFCRDNRERRNIRQKLGLDGKFVVGHVGAFSGWKGQDVLTRALAKAVEFSPSLCVLFVGDGPKKEAVETLATELGVIDRIHFAGFQHDVVNYLRAMDLYCQPSTEGEMLPNAIIEAMATGLGWVGSRISGLAELSGNETAGKLLRPGDIDGLASLIANLAHDRREVSAMAAAASTEVANKFSVSRVANVVESVYEAATGASERVA